MKELLLVCIGSFFGGGARYLVGKAVQSWVAVSFPWERWQSISLAVS